MQRLKAWIRFMFGFSKNETNGFIVLLPLLLVLFFTQPVYRFIFLHPPQSDVRNAPALDSIVATWSWKKNDSITDQSQKFFRFDPNTATREELVSLGMKGRLAENLIKYRTAGGRFTKKADVLRIFGMDTAWYQSHYAFIDLPERAPATQQAQKFTKQKPRVERFDLNLADTTQLIELRGIGSKLAARIVKYRMKLGGFVTMEQLHEVYGLDSAVIITLNKKSFIADNFAPILLRVNHASEQELAVHPYLNREKARAIATYRFQHGPFASLDDLKRIKTLDEKAIQRLSPYITFE